MPIKRLAFATLAAAALLPGASAVRPLQAQVTTGSVTGVVQNEVGQPIVGAQVQVRSRETGISRGAITRDDGRYFVAGLDVGSYDVTVRRIGFAPATRANVRVTLGQAVRSDVALQSQATTLTTVAVTANAASTEALIAPDRRDVRTTLSDSVILRLPTTSRNFSDFVNLTPQVSNAGPGASAGTNNRFNTVRIDGANATDLFGLGSTGQAGGQAGGRSVPLEAIKEFQVLLTPFDIRQGQFSGAVINAVTKSGTNDFHGSVVSTTRNQNFSRNVPYIRQQPFAQTTYGATVGGPIVRDKAFFFISTDFQKQYQQAAGPYLGEPAGSPFAVPASASDVQRFTTILQQQYGLSNIGNVNLTRDNNPLANVFGRLDFNLSNSTRAVLRYSYAAADADQLTRTGTNSTAFRFSNASYTQRSRTNAPLLQVYSNFANGAYNEFFGGLQRIRDARVVPIQAPAITAQVANPGGGVSTLIAGTENSSQGNSLDQDIYEITDNFSFSLGRGHRITVGTQNEILKVRNLFSQNSYGNYFFGSLDSLALGLPRTYTVGVRLGGSPDARFKTANYSAYLQDEWTPGTRFNVQYGVRFDLPRFYNTPSFNPVIDSVRAYGRETNQMPQSRVLVSPRIGFNYDVLGNQSVQLRGGVGLFAGQPPYVFISNVYANSGVDTFGNFSCSNPTLAPAFTTTDITKQPTACRATATQNPYNINTVDRNLKLPQYLKASAGVDRALGNGFVLSVEGLYTKAVNGLFYQNLALQTVTGVDRNGRVLYGDYAQTNGNPIPYTVEFNAGAPGAFSADGRRVLIGRTNVIDITNQSKDYAYSITGVIRKRYSDRLEGSLAYTYGHTYDVQSLTSSVALSNFQFGRAVSGSLTDKNVGISNFDQPHRIVAQVTYSAPTRTTISLAYFGQSGSPYSFAYNGDLNFDGQSSNDLIYVPRNVYDPNEIRFAVPSTFSRTASAGEVAANIAAQQAAFDRLITSTKCLNNARGSIIGRNSCRSPFQNYVNATIVQALPQIRGQNLGLRLDVLNLGNLLNSGWGAQTYLNGQTPAQPLTRVNTVGTTGNFASAIGPNGNQTNFTFNPNYQLFNAANTSSNYQLQIGLEYRF